MARPRKNEEKEITEYTGVRLPSKHRYNIQEQIERGAHPDIRTMSDFIRDAVRFKLEHGPTELTQRERERLEAQKAAEKLRQIETERNEHEDLMKRSEDAFDYFRNSGKKNEQQRLIEYLKQKRNGVTEDYREDYDRLIRKYER